MINQVSCGWMHNHMDSNEPDHEPLKELTVLYVEDDDDVRRELAKSLQRRAGTVVTAENGRIGLDKFHQFSPDIIITDIQMPEMDGLSMSKEIRITNPKIPIVVTTAFEHSEYLKHALDIGINKYITKPINPALLYHSLRECAQQLHTEAQLDLASLVFQNASEAMAVTEPDGTIITVNPAFTEVTGYTPEEIIGKNANILNSGRQTAAFYEAMWHSINTTGHWQGDIWDKRKNGEIYAKRLTINTIFDKNQTPHRRVALFDDITKKKETEELIWQYANFDPLTGLPNRRMLNDRLEQEILKAHRAGQPLALLFLDLDHFKEVNDTLGHEAGDQLIKEAAERLKSCVRESDTVARLGGDEFTIILSDLDAFGNVERVALDILQKIAEPFHLGIETAYVSASIGITMYPEDGKSREELLRNADQAMYAAKQLGRNRYSYFTHYMQKAAQGRMRIANDLRKALADSQFKLVYQPIVELGTGAIHKAEALLRWYHPTQGIISPAEFIPVAEETGAIIDIGNWVFREAAHQVKHWQDICHPEFQISINKSPVQFRDTYHSKNAWYDLLQELGLSGHSIVVEITEGLLLDTSSAVTEKLLAFRDQGMQVAIDDFGTGYSSLSYLKKFDIDFLKIDQSFVRNLTPSSNDVALCEAMIVMAHKLGIKVIAEGVENQEQRELLAQAGCDYAQGYLFSKPLPATDLELLFGKQLLPAAGFGRTITP